jgi:endo-1,4-beta-xylanase
MENGAFLQSRRAFLGGALATSIMVSAQPASAGEASLAHLARLAGLRFGTSIAAEIAQEAGYRQLIREHTDIVTTDWALKFDVLRPSRDRFNFAQSDMLLDFARTSRLDFRGHTLIWNENTPGWLKGLSTREITAVFDEHIETVMARYLGQVHSWDVVNEPFWPGHRAPGDYRQGAWFDAMGKGYVARAFRRAATVDTAARLVLNEAHTEADDALAVTMRRALLRLVDELQDQGVPLHAVGLQAHLQSDKPHDDRKFADFLRELAKRKVDIFITELDVSDVAYRDRPTAERDRLVAQRYYDFLSAVLEVPQVKLISTWQLADRFSWYRDPALPATIVPRGHVSRPLPFDDALRPKAAYHAIVRALTERKIG